MKLYNYTPEQLKELIQDDSVAARGLILGMQDTSNRMYLLVTELINNLYDDTVDTCVLNVKYRAIPFGLPCMNEYDAFTIINHPVQLERWRADFYLKYGNLPIELVESSDHRIRFSVVLNLPKYRTQYWIDHDKYLRDKYKAIENFNQ